MAVQAELLARMERLHVWQHRVMGALVCAMALAVLMAPFGLEPALVAAIAFWGLAGLQRGLIRQMDELLTQAEPKPVLRLVRPSDS